MQCEYCMMGKDRACLCNILVWKTINTLHTTYPRVVRLNPSSANIISDVWQKSLWRASFVFHQWVIIICGKAVAWKVCCVEYWCEKTRKHISKWTGRRDMTETLLKTVNIKLNRKLNLTFLYGLETDHIPNQLVGESPWIFSVIKELRFELHTAKGRHSLWWHC